jgi:AAA+ ATPase superfamily predicted ATPase/tetratricopeptide (TPR) repeat protein
MRFRAVLLSVAFLGAALPVLAGGTWYEYYLDAIEKDIPNQRWAQAIQKLRKARELKPESGLNEDTYGLNFIHYVPYYYEGLCSLRAGDHANALTLFNIEERKGVIKKTNLYRDLQKLRLEADVAVKAVEAVAEEARRVRRLRDEVARMRREGSELHRAGKFEEALSPLGEAQQAAKALDPGIQKEIADQIQKVRDDWAAARKLAEAAERAQKIEKGLADGQRLLQEGDARGAKLRFDDVLQLEAVNTRAREGQRLAEEMIMAQTTQATRDQRLQEGRALFEAGRYEAALPPLAEAAADPANDEAHRLLAEARRALEGMKTQKELRRQIDQHLADAARLMDTGRYSDAWVKLESVLQLDPRHVQAQERLRAAERMTREHVINAIFPNQPPLLTFLEPKDAHEGTWETDLKTMEVVGVATDDRGLSRVEFFLTGQLIHTQEAVPDALSGQLPLKLAFERQVGLPAGASELKIVAHDVLGLMETRAFPVQRRLRFHETAAFLPSAAGAAAGLVGLGYAVQRSRRRRALRNRFNPYIAGAPVMDKDMFFGRSRLLNRILNVLHHNSLMITGERRIGKTTFLHHLKRALEADEGTEYKFFPVSADLQGVPEAVFFHALMSDVLDQLSPPQEVLSTLRFQAEDPSYDGRDFSHDIQRVVEHIKTRTDKKVKLALLIDEVDVLNEYSERVNQRLRSIFMKTFSEHLVAVMSGVGIKRIWKSEGSPWYNFFDEIELLPFSREEAEALVREPVDGVFRYEPEAVELILARSGLKPYLIQKVCIHAVNRMLEEGRTTITREDVTAVLDTVRLESGDEEEGSGLAYSSQPTAVRH